MLKGCWDGLFNREYKLVIGNGSPDYQYKLRLGIMTGKLIREGTDTIDEKFFLGATNEYCTNGSIGLLRASLNPQSLVGKYIRLIGPADDKYGPVQSIERI